MPLYEYECTSCHRRTEKIQKYSDADLTVCPHCGGPLERTITAAAISFKGGGWYKDGYASAKPAAPGGGDAPTPAASSDTSASNAGSTASASGDSAASGDSSSSGDSAKIVTTPSASPAPAPAVATKT
jgi:putative FmdB family regulatory protein